MSEHTEQSASLMQGELDLLPPCPWDGGAPEPPAGAQHTLPDSSPSVPGARGIGRPTGSLNKRAPDLPNYVHRRYGSPLEHAARFVMQPLPAIAREIGSSRLEAWYARQAVLEFLARYVVPQPPKPVLVAARLNDGLGEAHLRAAQALNHEQLSESAVGGSPLIMGETGARVGPDALAGWPPQGLDRMPQFCPHRVPDNERS